MYFLKVIKVKNTLGTINLPKKSRVTLGFKPGTMVEVHLYNKEIWIYHSNHDEKKNQRYISAKGTVTIPAEFRHILNIKINTELHLYSDEEKQTYIIRLANREKNHIHLH